jgi:hypothetical protein
MLSPAIPSSSSFLNISTPVTTFFGISFCRPHHLDLFPDLHLPALHAPGRHRPATRDREDVLDRHQERLVDLPLRLRDVLVHRLHQLQDRLRGRVLPVPSSAFSAEPRITGTSSPGELVRLQQLTNLELDQVQQLRIVDHVDLVQEHHDVRNPHLTRQQDVLRASAASARPPPETTRIDPSICAAPVIMFLM